jgi:hypothetical protein
MQEHFRNVEFPRAKNHWSSGLYFALRTIKEKQSTSKYISLLGNAQSAFSGFVNNKIRPELIKFLNLISPGDEDYVCGKKLLAEINQREN